MRLTGAQMIIQLLERQGITIIAGIPGGANLPLYDALSQSRIIHHVLARHVEGASHMAEGYTRTAAGNIGVCIGTSGPAGTDMVTGLYSASADSIPILCITGQAPRARLHKEDFQAVDITSIVKPVTKWATTVLEPAQVPRAFQQAFHLMRSGRPGPVLIDLPFDVQMAEIEFRRAGGRLDGMMAETHYAVMYYPARVLGDRELWPRLGQKAPYAATIHPRQSGEPQRQGIAAPAGQA